MLTVAVAAAAGAIIAVYVLRSGDRVLPAVSTAAEDSTAQAVAEPRDLAPDARAPADSPNDQAPNPDTQSQPSTEERYPDAPGTPGELPFESGSLAERAWILRRGLRDLQDISNRDRAIEKLGGELLPTAIGGILDLQGRGIERQQGKNIVPLAATDEYIFMSQTKYFVFKRFEFPEYDLFRQGLDDYSNWSALGDLAQWTKDARARVEDAIALCENSSGK